MNDGALVAGVDLGGTHMQAGVVGARGEILGRASAKTDAQGGFDAVVERIAALVGEACGGAGIKVDVLGAVGIGAPGALDVSRRVVLEAPNLGWNDKPLADALGAALGGVRVELENDVNAAVLGEAIYGAAKGGGDVFGVWIGTGIGGGIVLDGRVFHGSLGTAGEFGRMVDSDGAYLEASASRKSIDRRIRAVRGGDESMSAGEMAAAYREGDVIVREVINSAMVLLGRCIANQVTVLSVGTVVVGGGLVEELGEAVLALITDEVREHVFPASVGGRVKIVGTALKENAGLLGAAAVAREALAVGGAG